MPPRVSLEQVVSFASQRSHKQIPDLDRAVNTEKSVYTIPYGDSEHMPTQFYAAPFIHKPRARKNRILGISDTPGLD